MKSKSFIILALSVLLITSLLSGCGGAGDKTGISGTANPGKDQAEEVSAAVEDGDKDFSGLSPSFMEAEYEYKLNFQPVDDFAAYVGDPMPYYEDGVFYLYYLKEGGDAYNHSIYLATTKDFLTFEEYDDPIIEASRDGGQDAWVGTGNIVKVEDKYYFFYTGHASGTSEYQEKILLATGDDPYHLEKVEGWEMIPPEELGQKRDFRDPQAYYDAETGKIYMTVTAAKDEIARILKYSMDADLSNIQYEGILLSDPTCTFWNLECSDCFQIGDKWYVTYSGQDDTLWYAMSDSRFEGYNIPVRLDGKLFYAAKQVSDGENNYMVGWARRSKDPFSVDEVSAWGGNMQIQQICRNEDGTLYLAPVENVRKAFDRSRTLLSTDTTVAVDGSSERTYTEVCTAYERFLLSGSFTFTGDGIFGLAFDFGESEQEYKLITVDPTEGCVRLAFAGGDKEITKINAELEKDKEYTFTYIQEGSVGVFYVDGMAALSVRMYGVSGKPVRLYAENNQVTFTDLCEYTMN